MTTVIVVVINRTLDSKEQVRAVFLQLDVNVLILYHSPKSFNPDVVFCAAVAIHAYMSGYSAQASAQSLLINWLL